MYALCDGIIFTGEAMVENHALIIQGNRIFDILSHHKLPSGIPKISCADKIICPGFIDLQVNGGGNYMLNRTPDIETCLEITRAHRSYGTTHLLLTCITDTPHTTQRAVLAIRQARHQDSAILGVHIEGPHLSFEGRGIHKETYIRSLTEDDIALYRPVDGEIVLVTLAPENVTPDKIRSLKQDGVRIALGHTRAAPDEIRHALKAGANCFTHLYNGMGFTSARTPGVVGVALDDRDSWCSLIADGYHVAPEMLRIATYAKPRGKIFLISDAMPPAAAKTPTSFDLYGETITYEKGCCLNKDGKLAGSAITLLDAVRYCVTVADLALDEALRMASTYPARYLGLQQKLGMLLPGYDAHPIALNHSLTEAQSFR